MVHGPPPPLRSGKHTVVWCGDEEADTFANIVARCIKETHTQTVTHCTLLERTFFIIQRALYQLDITAWHKRMNLSLVIHGTRAARLFQDVKLW